MTLSETSNDMDEERKMELMDLDFCSFLDGECNDKLEGDESGFSSSRRDRNTVWRDIRDTNNVEYSLMSNYDDNGDGIEIDGKPVANATFSSGGSPSTIRYDQQGPKSMNGFGLFTENENTKGTTQQSEQLESSNGPLQFTNNNNNHLDGTPTGHLFRPEVSAQLHPQAIQSSAACPPHDALNIAQAAFNNLASAWGASPSMFNTAVESGQLGNVKDNSSHPHSYFTNEKSLPANSNNSGELYANFLASQKTPQNIDSFSYEMPMPGFASNQETKSRSSRVAVNNCTTGNKGVKNAKEQKRAQQITNLIEQLRIKMEKDGWKIEVNSKYHTLSSCARYLKHMKNANDAKERAIQEVKNQLEVKQLRVEDESAQQERSEPESTFSDLTDSSMSAKISGKVANAEGKVANAEGEAHDDEKVKNPKSRKAQRVMVSHQSTLSSSGSSGAENEAKTTITDSTMSNLSENTNTNGENRAGGSNRSMSSNATTGDFKLDFQEVFIKSNIPQLLATDSGTIVTWNAFFLEITGLEPKELQRLTIFSLVPSRELSKLFEFVAKALKTSSHPRTHGENLKEFSEQSAITLPCVTFPREANDENTSLPLSMTVTMMRINSRKQCFHVVFSDQSGSNGTMGSISPDLLALLFAKPHESNPLYPKSLRKAYKKRKQPV